MVLMVIVGATPDMNITSEQQLKTIVTDVSFSNNKLLKHLFKNLQIKPFFANAFLEF